MQREVATTFRQYSLIISIVLVILNTRKPSVVENLQGQTRRMPGHLLLLFQERTQLVKLRLQTPATMVYGAIWIISKFLTMITSDRCFWKVGALSWRLMVTPTRINGSVSTWRSKVVEPTTWCSIQIYAWRTEKLVMAVSSSLQAAIIVAFGRTKDICLQKVFM